MTAASRTSTAAAAPDLCDATKSPIRNSVCARTGCVNAQDRRKRTYVGNANNDTARPQATPVHALVPLDYTTYERRPFTLRNYLAIEFYSHVSPKPQMSHSVAENL
jgi:hypothetical protein